MPKDIRNILNGAVFGSTLIVPGVSATIFAIILGFYDELIGALNHFSKNYGKNARYIAAFLLGIAVGSIAFSSVIMYLLDNFPFPTMLFFVGLLVGILPLVASKTKAPAQRVAPREIGLALFSMVALYALSRGVNTEAFNPADALGSMSLGIVLYVFVAGVINGATLVIPGLSGAFILLIMGLYPLIIQSVSSIGEYLANPGNITLLRDICVVLLPFGGGALIGCLSMARLMEKLMRDHTSGVYAVILGLVLGSVVSMLQNPMVSRGASSVVVTAAGVVALFLGGAASYFMGERH